MYRQLEATFLRSIGQHYMRDLTASMSQSQRFLITVGGDQLTGKSTLAQDLAVAPEVTSVVQGRIALRSTGQTMRDLAAEQGVAIGQLSSTLAQTTVGGTLNHNNSKAGLVDVNLDYTTCQGVAGKYEEDAGMLIMEGRQPAVMASFVNEQVPGSTQLPFRVYLKCSIREQALRYVGREISELAREEVEKYLPVGEEYASMESVLERIEGKTFAGHDQIISGFRTNMDRDKDDKQRFDLLYGADCHYRNEFFYDLVIDTSHIEPKDKVNAVAHGWMDWLVDNNFGVKEV